MDFGYSCDVKVVKSLPPGHPLVTAKPVAEHCALYGVKTADEWWESACETFFNFTSGKPVEGTIENAYDGVKKCTLFARGECIQEHLVKEGVCRLTRKEKKPSRGEYKKWEVAQTTAKRSRTKLWRYGDVGSDDEDGEFVQRF